MPDEQPKPKVLLVDTRKYAREPARWWTWLNDHYQCLFSYQLGHAIDQCQSAQPKLVIIGYLGVNTESFGSLLKHHGQPFIGLIESKDNPITKEILLTLVEAEMQKPRVLLVASEEHRTTAIMRTILTRAGFVVHWSPTIEPADLFLERHGADVIIVGDVEEGGTWAKKKYVPGRQEVLLTHPFSEAANLPQLLIPFTSDQLRVAVLDRVAAIRRSVPPDDGSGSA